MAQVFKLFCFTISVLLLADAAADSKKSPGETESNGQGEEDQKPTFLKTLDKVASSSPVIIAKKLSNITGKHLSKFSKDFESTLKAESRQAKQVNDENSFVPNVVKNNVFLPARALVKTSVNTLKEPVGNVFSSFKKTYDDELTKSEQDEDYVPIIGGFTKKANKPVALLKASKNVVGKTLGSFFGKASSLWGSSKENKAEKSEEKD